MESLNGIILKGIGGFYYVEAADAVYECKAKGKFRKDGIKPLAGDRVEISVCEDKTGTIDSIAQRRNCLERPPVANIDMLAIVSSVVHPNPSTLIIDELTAMAEKRGIEPIIIFTKADLANADKLEEIYRKSGFHTFVFSDGGAGDIKGFLGLLPNKVTALCGNTGVGKSTLLNRLSPGLGLKTDEISDKLGRGKHTTRQAELFPVNGGYIIDTAGFSSINILSGEAFLAQDLQEYFSDFAPFIGKCRFSSCTHVCDSGCAVCAAVESGELCRSRHDSYVAMYNEIKDLRKWQL